MEDLEIQLTEKKQDTGLATLLHLSVMAKYLFPFMGVIAPIIIWKARSEEDEFINAHAKSVINFQISTFIYGIVLVIIGFLIFGGTILSYIQMEMNQTDHSEIVPVGLISTIIIGVGIFLFWSIIEFVLIILGAVKANNGEIYQYPLTLKILK